ncbi:Guanine nucleotide-releasing factor 2, partial [Taenia solium]
MATLNSSEARSNPPGGENAASNAVMRLSEEPRSPLIKSSGEDEESLLPPLPSVEQMQRDVANVTCELQQAFFQIHNPGCTQGNEMGNKQATFSSETDCSGIEEPQGDSTEDPLHRTQEETVCEELIINGKKYRHTFQKRVVLESQKTREIFMLPASGETEFIENGGLEEKYVSSNFDKYNRAFEENGARLDLRVQNQEGGFSPRLVIAAQGESPPRGTCLSPIKAKPREMCSPSVNSATTLMSESESGTTSATPLVISHMYHFGHWDKTASILDPRLPARLIAPYEASGPEDDSIFCVTPAEWHHSDITYGNEAAGATGTTAKARIVACLQKFTQRSAQTGKQLYRSTYVQHTKIARWRSSEKRGEISPSCAITNEQSDVSRAPTKLLENPPHFCITPASHSCAWNLKLKACDILVVALVCSPNVLVCRSVANVSEVWKQVARSPLGGEEEAVISFPPLCLCSYDRLQLLQSLCPAAAAAIMVLGRQMPEMRGNSCTSPPSQLPRLMSTVTADAWCPRALMIMDSTEESLLFAMPDGFEIESTPRKQNCLLRGGTLDGLLVYALKIFRQKESDTYESLIPNIFMRLYPTFTIANEVVSRLIQRYLAFVPIEPGGLGCISEKGDAVESEREWDEAINTLRFLLKLLTRTERVLYDNKLENKIVWFAQLLKMDAGLVRSRSPRQNFSEVTLSNIKNGSSVKPAKQKNAISNELTRIAESLLDLVSATVGERRVTGEARNGQLVKDKVDSEINFCACTCYQRLVQFLRFKVNVLAEQITSMEEACFDGIQLYELINIKDLEGGNTPTLSRCIQHFNDLNFMVKCLIHIAKELGEPLSKVQSICGECDTCIDTTHQVTTLDYLCPLCGLQREALIQQRLMEDNLQGVSRKFVESRGVGLMGYLCLSPISHSLPLRVKRSNVLLENTLIHLCDLAQELKKMNNFSSFLAVILGLQNAPTQIVSKRLKLRLTKLGAYMLPPSFSAYRHDLETAKMPCLPYLGLVFQQLIHLDNGNVLFLSRTSGGQETANNGLITGDEVDANKVVNFWRCWKHYLILGYFMKRTDQDMLEKDEKASYEIEPDTEIQSYLKSFKLYSTQLRRHVDTTASEQSSLRRNRRKQRTKSV